MTFRELLIRRGIPWRSAPNSHISICCCFCPSNGETPDTKFRLSINLVSGACLCFNCGWRRRANSFPAILQGLNLEASLIETDREEERFTEAPHLPSDFQLLDQAHSDLDKVAIQYLRSRGITPWQVMANRIGVSFIGRYAYRIIFPVKDGRKLMGIVARDFTDQQEPRYLNSIGEKGLFLAASPASSVPTHKTSTNPRLDSKNPTEGLKTPGNGIVGEAKTVILSEGVFKALRISRLGTGFPSMALLGKAITELQVTQLQKRNCKEVIIWPDPDKPGRLGVTQVADKLSELGFLVGIVWPVYQPADEEPLDQMENTWKNIEGYSWRLRNRILLGT